MKRLTLAPALAALALFVPLHAQMPQAPEALDGVDTVLLLKTGKETFGKSAFKSTYGPLTYLFASAETKAEFDAAPEKYAVQKNGACARMAGAAGNPSNYAVVDGKIYLFGSDDCRTRFLASPAKFLPREPPPMPTAPEAAAAGRSILARAVAAHGGGRLASMTSYLESYKGPMQAGRPGPPPEFRFMWKFPGASRTERTFTMGGPEGRVATAAMLLTSGGVWNGLVDGSRPLSPQNAASFGETEMVFGWHLVPLLRNLDAKGTTVASLGAGTVEGATVERVRVRRDGVDVTLNVDATSNRVHSVAFVGRNRDSEFGDVMVLFSDYREVSGVLVPFAEKGLFDGMPNEVWTRTLEKVEVNPALDPALFTPPKGPAR